MIRFNGVVYFLIKMYNGAKSTAIDIPNQHKEESRMNKFTSTILCVFISFSNAFAAQDPQELRDEDKNEIVNSILFFSSVLHAWRYETSRQDSGSRSLATFSQLAFRQPTDTSNFIGGANQERIGLWNSLSSVRKSIAHVVGSRGEQRPGRHLRNRAPDARPLPSESSKKWVYVAQQINRATWQIQTNMWLEFSALVRTHGRAAFNAAMHRADVSFRDIPTRDIQNMMVRLLRIEPRYFDALIPELRRYYVMEVFHIYRLYQQARLRISVHRLPHDAAMNSAIYDLSRYMVGPGNFEEGPRSLAYMEDSRVVMQTTQALVPSLPMGILDIIVSYVREDVELQNRFARSMRPLSQNERLPELYSWHNPYFEQATERDPRSTPCQRIRTGLGISGLAAILVGYLIWSTNWVVNAQK